MTEEKIDTVKATLTTENSKMLSDDVIIEIVHAFNILLFSENIRCLLSKKQPHYCKELKCP